MKVQTNQEEPCVLQKRSLCLHPYRRHREVKGISLVNKYEKNDHFVKLHHYQPLSGFMSMDLKILFCQLKLKNFDVKRL